MTTVGAKHYREAERWLGQHPIVLAMAEGVREMPPEKLMSKDGTPLFEFMLAANEEFDKRGGKPEGHRMHIGAVASAVLTILGLNPSPS